MTKRLLLFSFVFAASVLCAAQSTRRLITDQDLFRFVWIADPQISPDGSQVAFVRVSVNKKHSGYDTELWKVPTDASETAIRLTSGPHDGSPRWSPDGKTLAFVRGVEKEGKPEPAQLCLLPMNGGEAWTITSLPKGVHGEKWSPDGKTILFVSDTTPDDLAKAKRKSSLGEEEHESDVRVITRALYRENGEGYLDFNRHAHFWMMVCCFGKTDVKDPRQITWGGLAIPIRCGPDGSRDLFLSRDFGRAVLRGPESVYSVPVEWRGCESGCVDSLRCAKHDDQP